MSSFGFAGTLHAVPAKQKDGIEDDNAKCRPQSRGLNNLSLKCSCFLLKWLRLCHCSKDDIPVALILLLSKDTAKDRSTLLTLLLCPFVSLTNSFSNYCIILSIVAILLMFLGSPSSTIMLMS